MGKSDSALSPRVEGSDEKHTPGPWHVTQGPGDNEWKLETTWHGGTAGIYLGRFTASTKTPNDGVADARLIAAAPDLYEALKAMFDRWEPDPEPYADRRMWEAARDALNKAEGR